MDAPSEKSRKTALTRPLASYRAAAYDPAYLAFRPTRSSLTDFVELGARLPATFTSTTEALEGVEYVRSECKRLTQFIVRQPPVEVKGLSKNQDGLLDVLVHEMEDGRADMDKVRAAIKTSPDVGALLAQKALDGAVEDLTDELEDLLDVIDEQAEQAGKAELQKVRDALQATLEPLQPWLGAYLPDIGSIQACKAAVRVSCLRLGVAIRELGDEALPEKKVFSMSDVDPILEQSLHFLEMWKPIAKDSMKVSDSFRAEKQAPSPQIQNADKVKVGAGGWKSRLGFGKGKRADQGASTAGYSKVEG